MYFAIEGVIGVGKTTLARLLQPAFQSNILLEVFEENPFLSSFYGDRERYAFQTQIFFLLSRYHQQHQGIPKAIANGANLISDYTFEKDSLFARINLKGDELEMYYRVHEALAEKMAALHLVVYLRASTTTLLQRISMRDRPVRTQHGSGYIQELNQAYDDFYLGTQRKTPVLVIDSKLRWILSTIMKTTGIGFEVQVRQALHLTAMSPTGELPQWLAVCRTRVIHEYRRSAGPIHLGETECTSSATFTHHRS